MGLGAEEAVVVLTPKPPAPSAEATTIAPPAANNGDPGNVSDEPAAAARNVPPAAEIDVRIQERAKEILQTLLEKMSLKVDVSARIGYDLVEPDEIPPLTLDITGTDLGLLIGRRGETLRALQFVTRQILNKEAGQWVPVVVDVESYLVRRRKTLKQLATRMADRVVFSGRRVTLEPMPAQERRIIHIQLRDHDKVYTQSTGEGDRRKVVILPK